MDDIQPRLRGGSLAVDYPSCALALSQELISRIDRRVNWIVVEFMFADRHRI